MLYVMAKAWVRRRPFFGWLFSGRFTGWINSKKGYDEPLVSVSYPWSRSPAKRMWEEGEVGTVAEAKLVPWISVWWSIRESKRHAWCLWKENWCKFCRIDHLYVSNAAMYQTRTSGIPVNKTKVVCLLCPLREPWAPWASWVLLGRLRRNDDLGNGVSLENDKSINVAKGVPERGAGVGRVFLSCCWSVYQQQCLITML